MEDEALYSRAGAGGVRQIDVHGLVAAAFVHRDSRAGDPNLHTHVAIANKVQGLDGKWRAIDGRLLYKAMVSVSETYNTQLEAHLRQALGLEFTERPDGVRDRRPVREVVGGSPALMEFWSSRRARIETRLAELSVEFQARHGRPPTPSESIRLSQQATLETREAKHEPRSYEEQRATWRAEAERVIEARGIEHMIQAVVGRTNPSRPEQAIPEAVLDRMAAEIVARVAQDRAIWQVWHLRAEASRRVRELGSTETDRLTQQLAQRALALSLPLDDSSDGIDEPAALRRRDGSSMYEVAGSRHFTSAAVVQAERWILAAAGANNGRRCDEAAVEIALLESVANDVTLNPGQAELVRSMATSGKRVQLALAAAGTGKTTALRVLAQAWTETGGTVLGLAPSAAAATTLGDAIGEATTLAKLLWDLGNGGSSPVDASTLIILDEAGMTDTISLAKLVDHVLQRGASLRLVGDDHQLAAIGAGGVLRDLQRSHGAVELDEVLRFSHEGEKLASLALRDGDPAAIAWYLDHDRFHAGSHATTLDDALQAWLDDSHRGLDSLMLAGTRETVTELNRRASTALRPSTDDEPTVALADGNLGHVGDVVLSRRNDRRLRLSATDWVKNGDRWHVERIHDDGALSVRHRSTGLRTVLPVDYVSAHVELGYATTIYTAQGVTVDATHTVMTSTESRQQLYVALTRGRYANHLYIPIDGPGDDHAVLHPATVRPPTALDIVETVLARDHAASSVTTQLANHHDAAVLLPTAIDRYRDALGVALEQIHGDALQALEHGANTVIPGLTDSDAWPTLRHNLLFTTNPLEELRRTAAGHNFADVRDPAALLAALLPEPTPGPLPWLPRIPEPLQADGTWAPYLQARAERITELARELRTTAHTASPPDWLSVKEHVPIKTIADVVVWRAAMRVEPGDQRPTGGPVPSGPVRRHQLQLDRQLALTTPLLGVAQLQKLGQGLQDDPHLWLVAHHLAHHEARGLPVQELLSEALAQGPLPAERPASALAWRIRELTHALPQPDSEENRAQAWAETVNPDLPNSDQWPTIRSVLASMPATADLDDLAQHLQGREPRDIRVALHKVAAAHRQWEQLPSIGRRPSPPTGRRHLRGIDR